MRVWKKSLMPLVFAMICLPAMAQQSDEKIEERMRQAEAELRQREAALEAEMRAAGQEREQTEEVEVRMREAERRLADAARQVADLSMAQLPRVERLERIIRAGRGPVLGITIGAGDSGEPAEGVEILGVSPGGAAEEAGLRAGDVITSINGESMTADSGEDANMKLLDFMQGVEEGDELDIEYLRNGKSETVALTPRARTNVFAFEFNGKDFSMPDMHIAPNVRRFENFVWMAHGDGFGDMELVKLTERLGSYFGTSDGLLVVRAPENEDLKLEDGDVILNIDGREPKSVSHAMRILGSYQGGEELKIEIMRDKRKRTIEIEIPEDKRQSWAKPRIAPRVQVLPKKPVVVESDRI